MAGSAFVFYRGTNHLFWKDFTGDSRLSQFSNDNTKVWLQGDLHAENYGAFTNDQDQVIYDLNDFDESVIEDYQYDIWRMAVSLVLVARQNSGFSQSKVNTILDAFSENYLDTMKNYRGNNQEVDKIYTRSNTYGRLDNFLADVENKESRVKMLDKWTNLVSNRRQFDLAYQKLEAASSSDRSAITQAMSGYGTTLSGKISYSSSYFYVKDIAKRILAGTGSLGTPRYYILIEGPSSSQNDDIILDVKLQGKPTAYYYWGYYQQQYFDSAFNNDAERHAIAYKALLTSVDDYLGWMNFNGGYYSVRERSPYKEGFDTTELNTLDRFTNLASQWGAILATDHARSDKDYDSSLISASVDKEIDIMTDGRHSEFRSLVRSIANSYADTVEDDYNTFKSSHLAASC
ncbi:uncharacterized protein TRIADDRAFT_56771 [Trichoplax adhaerens]|uniref:DUF2252 domain-containing protein n=1 Tax=Trichoplax adhaerens TaxID=10228 RepID=B3RWJ5_TRIAD|nr:hypothetical protein TRIADDRAFT_56771 [Trichoplax adhaerens]EDV25147.1 hypothetical protein TRIADDRAFT_56771 [Trichoplax adhaerens]|eukprot:XP_002113037.1 hypothetical protein TRIADDRAFT_56771 [Trichoplax adhaerens]